MDRVDAVVVGAGVVGLAVGRALAARGLETLVLEATGGIGNGISSRNSEVIHAGLYDPRRLAEGAALRRRPRAALCLLRSRTACRTGAAASSSSRRRRRRWTRCARSRAAPRRTASTGCAGSSGAEARALEPALRVRGGAAVAASTGIIDSHALMLAYLGDLEARRRRARRCARRCDGARVRGDGFVLQVGGDAPIEIAGRHPRQCRRAACAGARAPHRGTRRRRSVPRGRGSRRATTSRCRALAVHAPDLPGARAGRPRRAPDARPRRAGPLRAGRRVARRRRRRRSTTPSTRPRRPASTRRSGATGRGCRDGALPRLQRRASEAAGARATPAATSCCRGRPSTAWPGWSTCSGSNRRA